MCRLGSVSATDAEKKTRNLARFGRTSCAPLPGDGCNLKRPWSVPRQPHVWNLLGECEKEAPMFAWWQHRWSKERTTIIMTLQQLAQRIDTLNANLATAAEGLRGDILNLKAEIEALRALIPDPTLLASIDAALAQVETAAAGLITLDSETPPTPPPGTPA